MRLSCVTVSYFRWSRQKAVDYMVENTAMSLHNVNTEIDRYIIWPGQVCVLTVPKRNIYKLNCNFKNTVLPTKYGKLIVSWEAWFGGGGKGLRYFLASHMLAYHVPEHFSNPKKLEFCLSKLAPILCLIRERVTPLFSPLGDKFDIRDYHLNLRDSVSPAILSFAFIEMILFIRTPTRMPAFLHAVDIWLLNNTFLSIKTPNRLSSSNACTMKASISTSCWVESFDKTNAWHLLRFPCRMSPLYQLEACLPCRR